MYLSLMHNCQHEVACRVPEYSPPDLSPNPVALFGRFLSVPFLWSYLFHTCGHSYSISVVVPFHPVPSRLLSFLAGYAHSRPCVPSLFSTPRILRIGPGDQTRHPWGPRQHRGENKANNSTTKRTCIHTTLVIGNQSPLIIPTKTTTKLQQQWPTMLRVIPIHTLFQNRTHTEKNKTSSASLVLRPCLLKAIFLGGTSYLIKPGGLFLSSPPHKTQGFQTPSFIAREDFSIHLHDFTPPPTNTGEF